MHVILLKTLVRPSLKKMHLDDPAKEEKEILYG